MLKEDAKVVESGGCGSTQLLQVGRTQVTGDAMKRDGDLFVSKIGIGER